jgi:hypothetical protein
VEERILSIPGMDFKLVSIGLVNFSSVSIAEAIGAWAFTTTTGKVISGKSAYFRELKANRPAAVTPIQKHTVSHENLIAHLEILKISLADFTWLFFTIGSYVRKTVI